MATILVVDDEYLIRSVLKEVLKLNKHAVLEAADGVEAIDIIDPDALPDLIFIDHQMPRLNGIDCARKLKALYPSLKIILITGSFGIDDDGYLAANKHLFTDILLKPFGIKDVISAAEYALGGTAQERITCFGEQHHASGMTTSFFYP
jgi:CheY-like chemotaxis protein